MAQFNRTLGIIAIVLGMCLLDCGKTGGAHSKAIAIPLSSEALGNLELTQNTCTSSLAPQDELEIGILQENVEQLNNTCPTDVVTKDTICPTHLTLPSLWWADEQLGDKLLENWLAYPEKKRIDLVVNRQIWGLMDYYQRYAFIHRMGTVVRGARNPGENGYNLRIFNRQEPELCLASYTCSAQNCQLKVMDFGL